MPLYISAPQWTDCAVACWVCVTLCACLLCACRAVFAFSTELLKGAESEQQPQPRQQQQQPQQQSAADASSQTSSSSSSSASSGSYVLQPTGRYAHSPAYLRQVAAATGWQVAVLQEAQIRQNAGQPIWGSLCILQRVDNAL